MIDEHRRRERRTNAAGAAAVVFTAAVVRWYAEHPEHRAAIGTPTELDRLISAVTAAPR